MLQTSGATEFYSKVIGLDETRCLSHYSPLILAPLFSVWPMEGRKSSAHCLTHALRIYFFIALANMVPIGTTTCSEY